MMSFGSALGALCIFWGLLFVGILLVYSVWRLVWAIWREGPRLIEVHGSGEFIIPKGTRVITEDGRSFVTTEEVAFVSGALLPPHGGVD